MAAAPGKGKRVKWNKGRRGGPAVPSSAGELNVREDTGIMDQNDRASYWDCDAVKN